MKSIFTDKAITPTANDLKAGLGNTYGIWESLEKFTKQAHPDAVCAWHFSGEKYGWSFRISDKKRVIVYLLPRDGFFKAAFVFGPKATDAIMHSTISGTIKNELQSAKAYAEGRGIRIDVRDASILKDLEALVTIKVAH